MPRQIIQIGNIWGGQSASRFFIAEGQYSYGIGIDPESPISDAVGDREPAGVIRPIAYEDFSGANITGDVMQMFTNPKDTKVYTYQDNGKIVSYSSSLGSEALVGTPTSGNGSGAAYYNNYAYFATTTDVSRYGPLDGSPSLSNNFWTSTLSLTALTDTTYPTIRNVEMANHTMHVHGDNKLYFCDYKDGQGLVHFIKTKKVTNEGDTNDGSTYGALDLPFGFMPVAIESLGTDLVIAAIETTNGTLIQGKAKLFFWDTFSDSFYTEVQLPDAIVTAMKNVNGSLFIWTGSISSGSDVSNGYRVSVYAGGAAVQQVYYSPVGAPPLAGAVEATGTRLMWGTFTQIPTTTNTAPEYYAVVMALSSRDNRLPGGVHCIARSTASGTASDGFVTSLLNAEQDSFSYPKLIMAHRDAGGYGIDKKSTTYQTHVWRYPVFVGQEFAIKRIRMTLGADVAANMTITPTVFVDDYDSSSTNQLDVINNTNYANSERIINYYPDINGKHDFTLELRFSGTALLPVILPLTIEVEIYD